MKIIVPKKALLAVRRECRKRYPKEYLVGIYGRREANQLVIERFIDIPHTADEDTCNFDPDIIPKLKIKALKEGLEYLGSVHSHCHSTKVSTCEHLSKIDITDAAEHGEAISGIVLVYQGGERSEVHWYMPTPPPEVELI